MPYNHYILVSGDSESSLNRRNELISFFEKEIAGQNLTDDVQVVSTIDTSACGMEGPFIKILPENIYIHNLTPEKVRSIVQEHLAKGIPPEGTGTEADKQFRIVLRNCGVIDPERIEDYILRDGYSALEKVIFDMTPEQVIDEIRKSGLRGRGGAGFPTGLKWSFTKEASSDQKYVVCNADEGDPGAYMDRSTLEGDPHSVLEAMAIAGCAVGADTGYIYIRAEYPLAIKRLELAIKQATELGLLGDNILGSGFSFNIEIRYGAGAFVCGEETALLASLEGERGTPKPRPPFPAVKGLWGKPTVVNNVETFANIPVVILKGSSWFSSIGSEKSKGTKVFAVTGKVKNSGLVEVPMGTPLRDIIFSISGGIRDNKKFKAVQTGGPSGGVIPEQFLDTPIDYDNLTAIGSMMGSGGMIVMDEDDCMVDVNKFYLQFSVDESCGKCAPCRIGGRELLTYLEKISGGQGELEDIEKMKRIGKAMQKASLCALGQTTSNPIQSALKYFYNEYEDHIVHKKCTAGKCVSLLKFIIITDKCVKCGVCKRVCPVSAISGDRDSGFLIDQSKCIKCGLCREKCKFEAINKG
ncbi:MAG: NADH-quinone oxidoreductase subunit NuoF [Spirochaetes bacterium]|nr:NADH-quinone oxidoreductase subunit NuoF [Spirochaetota bacterium]